MYWHKAPYQMRSLLSARDRTIRQLKLNLKDKQQAINNYEFSVSKLKEWVRIYKALRDAHKNHRRKLKADRDEYRNLYHLGEAKIMSREAIIEQLSETELAKDVTSLEAENEDARELADLVQCKWEEFGCDDGIVTVKYPWAIQEEMRKLCAALLKETD